MIGFVHDGDFRQNVRNAVRPLAVKGLELAGKALVADIRWRIDTQGPPRSAPSKSPRMESGRLRDSIIHNVDPVALRLEVIAGTPYAYYLEFGTKTMAPRPFMRVGLSDFASRKAARYIALGFTSARHAPGGPLIFS